MAGDELFDSKREYARWCELQWLEKVGKITELKRQVPFELIPKQYDRDGKKLESEVKYIADFTYFKDGKYVVEDSKGYKTKDYVIKRKLMLFVKGIQIVEV